MFAGIFAVSKDVEILRRASPVAVGNSLIPRLGPSAASYNEEVGKEMAIYFISRVKMEVVEVCIGVLCCSCSCKGVPVSPSPGQSDPTSRIHQTPPSFVANTRREHNVCSRHDIWVKLSSSLESYQRAGQ